MLDIKDQNHILPKPVPESAVRLRPATADWLSPLLYDTVRRHGGKLRTNRNVRKGLKSRCGYRCAKRIRMSAGRVLVVEDDDSLRRVTQMHLEKFGFTTTTSPDAEQALQLLDKNPLMSCD